MDIERKEKNMMRIVKSLVIATIFGAFGCSFADAGLEVQPPLKPNTVIGLKDLLSTGDADLLTSPNAGQLNLSTYTGNIRFLKAYFYSNPDCSNGLLGAASVIDNSLGFPFTNQTVNLNSYAAYQLATNLSIPTSSIQCLALYVDGSNETSNAVTCQSFVPENCTALPLQCEYTGAALPPVTWASVNQGSPCGVNGVNPATRYAYVPQGGGGGQVKIYSVNSSGGALTETSSSPVSLFGATSIALNNGFAYITSSAGLYTCSIDASDGSLSCGAAAPVLGATTPAGITINTGYVYITDLGTGSSNTGKIFKCPISVSGAVGTCTRTAINSPGFFTFDSPTSIVINNNFAYVVNSTNNTLTKCSIDTLNQNEITACGPTPTSGAFPGSLGGIAIENGFAYLPAYNVPPSFTPSIYKCDVDPSFGTISNCGPTATSGSYNTPQGIVIMNGVAYITNNSGGSITQCNISSGNLVGCTTPTTGLSIPRYPAIF